jgi:hypothetical protein
MVFGTVSFIEGFQPSARKISTLITKPDKSLPQQIALFFHEGTVLAARQAPGAISPPKPFLFQFVPHRQVAYTYSAVHTARGNKVFFHLKSPYSSDCKACFFTVGLLYTILQDFNHF